jgi:hypothetical protein
MWLGRFATFSGNTKLVEPRPSYPLRATRFELDARVFFTGDDRAYAGQSIDVSRSGLLARFRNLPEIWTIGQLELEVGSHYFNIPGRVVRLEGDEVGFAFKLFSQRDLSAVSLLIDSVSGRPLFDPAVS